MEDRISLSGLDRAAVLAVLYNASRPQGMGFVRYDPTPMTVEEARKILDGGSTYFDYLKGRVMKIDLSGDELSTWGYNRDNGENAAENAIKVLQLSGDANPLPIQVAHEDGKHQAADIIREHSPDPSIVKTNGGAIIVHLGTDDVMDILGPAIEKATK